MTTTKSITEAIDLMKQEEKEFINPHLDITLPIEQIDDRFFLPMEQVLRLFGVNKILAIQQSKTGWLAAFHVHFLDIDFIDYLAKIDPRHHKVLHNKNVFAYLGTNVTDAIEGLLIEYSEMKKGLAA